MAWQEPGFSSTGQGDTAGGGKRAVHGAPGEAREAGTGL